MSPAAAARLLRLYPAHWRTRYGVEFAALLEDYPLSLRTLLNAVSLALEAHLDALGSTENPGGALAGRMWCAWMLAVAAGLALYGVVDDSPFVNAMHGNLFLRLCWQGLEAGSLVAAAALALGGIPLVWSAIRYACARTPARHPDAARAPLHRRTRVDWMGRRGIDLDRRPLGRIALGRHRLSAGLARGRLPLDHWIDQRMPAGAGSCGYRRIDQPGPPAQ